MPDKQSPVDYAEDTLGVHEVYEQAQGAKGDLDAALDLYSHCASNIRSLNESIETREYELAGEIRAEKPDISQTALERAIKDARHSDDALRKMRVSLRNEQDEQERAHASIEKNKYRLRVLSARMNELGGLLAFLAAAKQASTQRKHK